MEQQNKKIYKSLSLLCLNLFITSLILVASSYFSLLILDVIVNPDVLFGIGMFLGFLALVFWENSKGKWQIHFNHETEAQGCVSPIGQKKILKKVESDDNLFFKAVPYLFLFFLLLIAINQFWKNPFLTAQSLRITILAITFGAVTFWRNRERVEQEIEDEKVAEEKAEEKREGEFDLKFKRLTWFDFSYGFEKANKIDSFLKRWLVYVLLVLASPFVFLGRLPYSFVRWMYREGWWYSSVLILIVVLGFVLRVWIGMATNPDLDEGQLIYDAKLVGDGLIPFKDFATRAPLLVYSLFIINKLILGGFFLLSSKILVSLLFSIATLGLFYLSNELFGDRRVSLLSITLFNLLPFILFYSTVLHVAQASIVFLVLFTLYLIRLFNYNSLKYSFYSGLVLGVGYLVRRDLIIYTLFFSIILFYLPKIDFLGYIKKITLFSVGFILGISPILYLVLKTDIFWIDKFYGLSSLLSQTVGTVATKNLNLIPMLAIIFILNSFLFITLIKFFFENNFRNKNFLKHISFALISITLFFYTIFNLMGSLRITGFNIVQTPLYLLIVLMSVLYFIFISIKKLNLFEKKKKQYNLLFFLFIYYYLILFIFLKTFHFSYFILNLFIPLLFFSKLIIQKIKDILKIKTNLLFFFIFFMTFFCFLNIALFGSYNYERSWDLNQISEIKDYLANLKENVSIFTVGYTLVIDSQREIVFNITHHQSYDLDKCPHLKYDPLPCLEDLVKLMDEQKIDSIILDQRTKSLIENYFPLKESFLKNYLEVRSISRSIQIYESKSFFLTTQNHTFKK